MTRVMTEVIEKISSIITACQESSCMDYRELESNLFKLENIDIKGEMSISRSTIENIISSLGSLHPTIVDTVTFIFERIIGYSISIDDKLSEIIKLHLKNNAQNNPEFLRLLKSVFKKRSIISSGAAIDFMSKCNLKSKETMEILNEMTKHQDILSFPLEIIMSIASIAETESSESLIYFEFLANYLIHHQPAYYPQVFPYLINILSRNLINGNMEIRLVCQDAIRHLELLLHPRKVPEVSFKNNENFFLKRNNENHYIRNYNNNNDNNNDDDNVIDNFVDQTEKEMNPIQISALDEEIELPDLILNPIE